MIVGHYMTHHPVVISPDDPLSSAQRLMQAGKFRRLPVVADGRLVGIVTLRDLQRYLAVLDSTKVQAAMSRPVVTVSPIDTIERAAQLILKKKIGGLPVVDGDDLVGIVTYTDVLETFLDVLGASDGESTRIDLLLRETNDLADASQTLRQQGAEILGLGTHRQKWGSESICYLRLRCADAAQLASLLQEKGYNVVGIHG